MINALIYTLIVIIITIIIVFKDFKKNIKEYSFLILFGAFIGFIVENILIYFNLFNYIVEPKLIFFSVLAIPLYFCWISLVNFFSRFFKGKINVKNESLNYYILVFVITLILAFIFDLTAINLVNFWQHNYGIKIFNVSIIGLIAESLLITIIFVLKDKIQMKNGNKNSIKKTKKRY
ncbi:MAG: hypothetical protein JSW08_02280 [archaeon]|nr:MAG: hypothetical protein JSW08_02280 [archaeon]